MSIKKGMGFLTEDRKYSGLFMHLSCRDNINALSYESLSHWGMINQKKADANANLYKEKLRIKVPTIFQYVKNLSGGNQQKVMLSKWISKNSKLLIIDEPTVGIDVGAKLEIYQLIEQLVQDGTTIILISSYLPEVLGLSDRLMVISEGKQMDIIERKDFHLEEANHEEKFIKLASGIKIE